jgi:hypothetical protein
VLLLVLLLVDAAAAPAAASALCCCRCLLPLLLLPLASRCLLLLPLLLPLLRALCCRIRDCPSPPAPSLTLPQDAKVASRMDVLNLQACLDTVGGAGGKSKGSISKALMPPHSRGAKSADANRAGARDQRATTHICHLTPHVTHSLLSTTGGTAKQYKAVHELYKTVKYLLKEDATVCGVYAARAAG